MHDIWNGMTWHERRVEAWHGMRKQLLRDLGNGMAVAVGNGSGVTTWRAHTSDARLVVGPRPPPDLSLSYTRQVRPYSRCFVRVG